MPKLCVRPPDAAARSIAGGLVLRFACRAGTTRLVQAERTPPWHVQRLMFLDAVHPTLATAVLLNGTAGLFGGDRLELNVSVQRGAMVSLTTPTMTRAFAMDEGTAELRTRVHVCAGGYVELLPQPLLLCARASVAQRIEMTVEPGGVLAQGEVVAFGRAAAGEVNAFRRFEQRVRIRLGDAPVLSERLSLDPSEAEAPGLLGGYAAYGSLNLIADGAEQLLATVRHTIAEHGEVWGGASVLPLNAGVAVRLFGHGAHVVQLALQAIVLAFREHSGPTPCARC